jgi:dihydropyrimidinase/dihydroorotase
MHVTTPATIAELRLARSEGGVIIGQTGPHYLTLPSETYKINVPLRPREVIEVMWPYVAAGEIDSIGSDHVCHIAPRERFDAGNVWTDLSGFSSRVEALLPMLLSEGVNRGRITIERLVELACEGPAKAFGLFPLKGSLELGADADVVLVDLKRKRTISKGNLVTNAGWSAWEGWEVTGAPVMTLLRGSVAARWPRGDGPPEILGSPRGRYLARKPGHARYPLEPLAAAN